MAVQAADQQATLERMWEMHREAIRRLLLSLTRDLDLADDLLQETYLSARAGMATYRGGDPRAWLAAIARNAYRAHVRRSRRRAEVPLDADLSVAQTYDRDDLMAIRQALSALSPALRTALIMKHYAGYTYQEIARHQRCAVGTAKWRVNQALERLRLVLLPERRMEMHGTDLVDYTYGVLPQGEAAKIVAHLKECVDCRKQAQELKRVAFLLDGLEGDHKQMHFVEAHPEGTYRLYVSSSHVNASEQALTEWTFQNSPGSEVERIYQDGEEVSFVVGTEADDLHLPASHSQKGMLRYAVTLAQPVLPGRRLNDLLVFPSWPVPKLEGGRYRLQRKQGPGSNVTAFVQVIRLPEGAQLLSADPKPTEMKTNEPTTLMWRTVLEAYEFFECAVEYEL